MLRLARKLSDCDAKYFGGWVIAGVEVKLSDKADCLENSVLLDKARRCVHEARGYNSRGELVQSLRLFLVLPSGKANLEPPLESQPVGELVYRHSFSKHEIDEYISATGDENVIHKGPKPLVPGIYMLYALQQWLGLRSLQWKASFLSPVYVEQELKVYAGDKGFEGYVDQRRVFVVKI